ncbi:MAG: FtsQ-type POTRA domain-containing protein [Salinibacterium sp.]|nr:MAG: FtsQ-type POTRA domain-containing protein [Salinibacterium sp.]
MGRPVAPKATGPKSSESKAKPPVTLRPQQSREPKRKPPRTDDRQPAKAQRRADRAEVRRFTRHTRNRRIALGTVSGILVSLIAVVLLAVYSPLLSLRTITIDGTSRVDAKELESALSDQLGKPLALIDFDRITKELGVFPLVRSYVTETVPPDTLRIHIVERQPVGQIRRGDGFVLVDPAGVIIDTPAQRVTGLPIIEVAGDRASGRAFDSSVEVLLAMPPSLLSRVDSISARTHDDVTLVLVGVGQHVRWGSAQNSAKKAALLAALIKATNPSRKGEFDVSAPSNGIFRPA